VGGSNGWQCSDLARAWHLWSYVQDGSEAVTKPEQQPSRNLQMMAFPSWVYLVI
jgi:hypothetical protein